MELTLKNIGKIGEATVRLDGITVIAGENDTGKSTVSRALFSLFSSFNNIEEQVKQELEDNLNAVLNSLVRHTMPRAISRVRFNSILENIMNHADEYTSNPDLLCDYLWGYRGLLFSDRMERPAFEKLTSQLIDSLNVSTEEIFCSVIEKGLNAEFNGQVQNIYAKADSEIRLNWEAAAISIRLSDGHVTEIGEWIDFHTGVFYLDTPLILDNTVTIRGYNGGDHRVHLRKNLFDREKNNNIVGEIVANKKLERIYAMIAGVCGGEIVITDNLEIGYQEEKGGEILIAGNISNGLKSFVILKTLLQNGSVKPGSVILLDEPEIHLHPEWQLLYAELIVLLQKEFDLRILINTHSHYFLDAIEVYSRKHGVADQCRYYLSTLSGHFATMTDVTGDTELIYQKLARPLQRLENERYRNED